MVELEEVRLQLAELLLSWEPLAGSSLRELSKKKSNLSPPSS